jgi:hypothetical protein
LDNQREKKPLEPFEPSTTSGTSFLPTLESHLISTPSLMKKITHKLLGFLFLFFISYSLVAQSVDL